MPALIASIGLGLYVSSVIGPLKTETNRVKKDTEYFMTMTDKAQDALELAVREMQKDVALLSTQLTVAQSDIHHLQIDLSRLSETVSKHENESKRSRGGP